MLRGAVIGVMRRHASGGDWRTNVSLGGRAEPCELEPEAERLALAAARATGAEMAGVDLVPDLDRGNLSCSRSTRFLAGGRWRPSLASISPRQS